MTYVPNAFDKAAALAEINHRNAIRRENGMTPVNVEKELERLRDAFLDNEFRRFCKESDELPAVEEKVLADLRITNGDPEWKPSGMLSGDGLLFRRMVESELMKKWEQTFLYE